VNLHAPLAFRPSSAALHVEVAGTWVSLLPSGAVWIESARTLICADLHLEKGSAYAQRGQLLPPYDTRETLRRLMLDAAAVRPDRIVFLGDTLHDADAHDRIDEDDASALGEIARGRALLWIVGNHDPEGPGQLPGEVAETLAIDTLILRHEPQPGHQAGEVAGHLHPCARVVGTSRSVRRRRRRRRPAGSGGGLSIRDGAFAGMFARPPLVGAIGSKRVHAVSWASVRGE
jgi:DNA ligase-associated metallophosphoesterase